jgi:choice-of-anchor C domain-containing protein
VFLFSLIGTVSVFAAIVGTNGSFETGTAINEFSTLYDGDTSISGWIVTGMVDHINGHWMASNGTQSVDLNGLSEGAISQTLPTVVGATYDVTFDLSGNPYSAPGFTPSPSNKEMSISATGATTSIFSFDTSIVGNTTSDMKWAPHNYSFVAIGTSTTLTFASLIPGAFGPALDNVVITEKLPEFSESRFCEDPKNHGQYVSCVAKSTTSAPGKGATVSTAGRSSIGKK